MRRRDLLGSGGKLTLSPTSNTVSGASSYVNVYVYWNDVVLKESDVTVSSNQTWATPTWYASSGYFTLLYESNGDLKNSRSATITVTYKGVNATYTLTQRAAKIEISTVSVTNDKFYEPFPTAHMLYVKLNDTSIPTSNYTIISFPSWVTYTKQTDYYLVNTTLNTTGSSRIGDFRVSYNGKTYYHNETQDAAFVADASNAPYDGIINGYKYVTFGSYKLATTYIGSSGPGRPGNLYQWGAGTATYVEGATQYYTGDGDVPLTNDTARLVMGGDWRMLKIADIQALQQIGYGERAVYKISGQWCFGAVIYNITDRSKYVIVPSKDYNNVAVGMNTNVDFWSASKWSNGATRGSVSGVSSNRISYGYIGNKKSPQYVLGIIG